MYCEAGKQLAKAERYSGIGQLVSCIKNSGTSDVAVTDMCDEMLTLAVATFTKANVSGTKVEDLIKLISDRGTKVSNKKEILCPTHWVVTLWIAMSCRVAKNMRKDHDDEIAEKNITKYMLLFIISFSIFFS